MISGKFSLPKKSLFQWISFRGQGQTVNWFCK